GQVRGLSQESPASKPEEPPGARLATRVARLSEVDGHAGPGPPPVNSKQPCDGPFGAERAPPPDIVRRGVAKDDVHEGPAEIVPEFNCHRAPHDLQFPAITEVTSVLKSIAPTVSFPRSRRRGRTRTTPFVGFRCRLSGPLARPCRVSR